MEKKHHFSFKYLLHDIVKWFGSWQVLIFYRIRKRFDGEEAKKLIKGGAVLVCNHVGYSDPFVLQSTVLYRRFFFLAMKELYSNKVKSWIYKNVFLTFPVDRQNPCFITLKETASIAKQGNLLCIFPEGHINRTNEAPDDFKGGAVLIAYLANVPIVPVYHKKRKSIWNMTEMVIGKPINVKEMVGRIPSQEKINEVAKYLKEYEQHLMTLCPSYNKK